MSTPEEMAAMLVQSVGFRRALSWRTVERDSELIEQIAAALRAYAALERERCANLCDEVTDQRAREMGLEHYEHLTGRLCAAAIRALAP